MDEFKIKRLSFSKRPIPIPADYRPLYKIALIVLILRSCCRADKANLIKLHLFSWALMSDKNMETLREYVASNFQMELAVWGIEPALNRALQFAIAENFCELAEGKNYRLTEKGIRFHDLIALDIELFRKEKAFLSFIGKNKITDTRIEAMTKQWTLFRDEN